MMFYLGNKVDGIVKDSERKAKNKMALWDYGYNSELDIVVISKDGTLGEVYEIQGLKIGLPEKPDDKLILNYNKSKKHQKWQREELPYELTDEGIAEATASCKDQEEFNDVLFDLYDKHHEFIERQYEVRNKGLWAYIKGYPIYMPGTYAFGIQWCRELQDYPDFRVIQNELMIFWEACKADDRCFGMQYVKNRRMGATLLGIFEHLESGTIHENKLLGIISKKGADSSKIFRRLVIAYKRLPSFFRPITDGTTTPKKQLIFDEPTRKRRKGEAIKQGVGLQTMIEWHNTDMNAMDGDAIFRSVLDECYASGTKILCQGMVFKNIEDIQVGDIVIVEGGKHVRVAKTTSGETQMYRVSQPYSKDYIVSKNHRLYLEQRCNTPGIKDDGVKIMTPDQYLRLGKYRKRTTFGVRSKGLELPYTPVSIDPYMLGLWLGDGDAECARFVVNTETDIEIAEYIEQYCDQTGHNLSIRKSSGSDKCRLYAILRKDDRTNLNGKHYRNRFTQKLRELDLINNKHIPKEYINNSKDVRLKILAGLLDTDGYLAYKNGAYIYELAFANKGLAKQAELLSKSLGFKTVFKKKRSNLNTDYYVIKISGKILNIPCRVERKIVPAEYQRQYASHINKIDVKPIGVGKYHGIQIEADNDNDRRLILEDFTISMNSGKYPTEVPFSKYWDIVKTSHTVGIEISGKSMVVSTVNSRKKGGGEYQIVWDDSDLDKRDGNGRTKSGLYRIFIPARYCLEGKFDQYGFTIMENPVGQVLTDKGKYTNQGSIEWLANTAAKYKNDPEKLNEHKRQFPDTIKDAFRDETKDCEFNLVHLMEQIDHNEEELNDIYLDGRTWTGNDAVIRGKLMWENGERFGKVAWREDPEGRFYVRKGCLPPLDLKNQYSLKTINGWSAFAPKGAGIGCIGVDPYNRSRTADGRGSKGAIIGGTGYHTNPHLPVDTTIFEYIARPKRVEIFFEEVLMASIFWSFPFLAELSNEAFLKFIKENNFRHFSMNNPFKRWSKLNPTERELGGAPQQDSKIADAQFYAAESFIEDHIGVARHDTYRNQGEMGDFPFSRTLYQFKDVDLKNRTDYDAYIAWTLQRIGNKRASMRIETEPQEIEISFQKFDNSGAVSRAII